MLTDYAYLNKLNPANIKRVIVYKGGNSMHATTPIQWRGLDRNGLIAIRLKKKRRLKSQTLAQLGRQLRVQGPISYTINDLPANGALCIATASIAEIKLARTPIGTTVGVWLLQEPSPLTKTYPLGTIMIQDTARR
ncbi:hypothetical protein [Hymenobacter cheonanensis]|uniref:hypothetical protein n=1 Tax=Hymenobacter sp. CA2-7 TaxID=3063993 RepID=UPI0027129A9A|nr:hypothetical protein [Hymenobacter sp. CA2-7]MDO7888009.1 hypothetical protein [Hymenobacter sp. CA2-7]